MIGKVIINSANPPCKACGGMDGYHYSSCSLIAAAPELLEACKALLDIAPFAENPMTRDIHALASAAVRKAEGRPANASASSNARETAS